ncbi:restriction endonuclease [Nocardia takedensis]|uniref:restriction endonuclease n=1 Tax=Nocardia takedensis TaxID=259390 RepID=UPI00068819A7|nr:restriction endonuclease [Nocardia takedensis]
MVKGDGIDRWPTFELSPAEYERAVAEIVKAAGHDVIDWRVEHLDTVEGMDGSYIIDVTARFRLMGADFLILFECKRHSRPVEREDVQVLQDKLRSTGAHKGVVVAASGFQRGALQYAQKHGIACVRLVDGAWTYETRDDAAPAIPHPLGTFVAYACNLSDRGYRNVLLTDQQPSARKVLFAPSGDTPMG